MSSLGLCKASASSSRIHHPCHLALLRDALPAGTCFWGHDHLPCLRCRCVHTLAFAMQALPSNRMALPAGSCSTRRQTVP